MRETDTSSQSGRGGAREASSPAAGQCHAPAGSSIQDLIRLTARFYREWFHSLDTLETDLQRFAALHRLDPEETHQVRAAIEALYREEGVRAPPGD